MGADGFEHSGNFLRWKTKSFQQCRGFFDGIDDIIPFLKGRQIFGAMTDKNAEVVQPGCREEHVVIEGPSLGELRGQLIKPRLVAELLARVRVRANIIADGLSVTGQFHAVRVAYTAFRYTCSSATLQRLNVDSSTNFGGGLTPTGR